MRASLLYDAAVILAGQATKPVHVAIGAAIAIVWIGMDVHQYVAFLLSPAAELPFPI